MTIATTVDVVSRLGRPLADDEGNLVLTLIDDAENLIRVAYPGSAFPDDVDQGLVKQVVANAVVRVLRNPDGYRNEAAGGVSYTLDSRVAAGFLTILDAEWSLLGLSARSTHGGGFAVAPTLGTAYASPMAGPWYAPWL